MDTDTDITCLLAEIDELQKDMQKLQWEWMMMRGVSSMSNIYLFILLSAWIKTRGWMRMQLTGKDLLLVAWFGAWCQLQNM